jgi:hypothetical protein
MPKWYKSEAEVKPILREAFDRIVPDNSNIAINESVDYIYRNGFINTDTARLLDRYSVLVFNTALNKMIDCGCSGAREDLAGAIALFNSNKIAKALTNGASQMINNTGIKIMQYYSTVVSK